MLTITPPKDLSLNLHWRAFIWRRGDESKRDRDRILERCKHDFDFWVDSFVWQFNPNEVNKVGPFILRKRQSEIFKVIDDRLDLARKRKLKLDTIIEKSREEGASWGVLAFIDHRCLFWPWERFICISHTADAVDKSGDPDSLFWKVDHIHEHLPEWMGVPRGDDRIKFRFSFPKTKSVLTGQACSQTSTVGGRGVVFLDELGKMKWAHEIIGQTADVGPRIMCSTHYGVGTAFYQQCIRPDVHKEVLHWSHNPEKNQGMYRVNPENHFVDQLDKDYRYPEDYPFITDGSPVGGPFPGLRSPWYDSECIRRGSTRDVAMHLDIYAEGSESQFFDPVVLRVLQNAYSCDPYWEGDLDYHLDSGEPRALVYRPGGPVKLWCHPDKDGRPPQALYGVGADIAAGTGATPSCISAINAATGEKVMQYQNPFMEPKEFATFSIAICRLFASQSGEGAKFAWENAGGVGKSFTNQVLALRYLHIYFRQKEFALEKIISDMPGWYPSPDGKRVLLQEYRSALTLRQCINRDRKSLDTCLQFIYQANGSVDSSLIEMKNDPSGARENHGDQCIADALAWKMAEAFGVKQMAKQKQSSDPPHGSLAWRRQHRERSRLQAWAG